MAEVKKTSLNLDPGVVANAKIAIVEAEHLGIDAPRNLSALVNDALATKTRTLREEIERARGARGDKGKATRPARSGGEDGKPNTRGSHAR